MLSGFGRLPRIAHGGGGNWTRFGEAKQFVELAPRFGRFEIGGISSISSGNTTSTQPGGSLASTARATKRSAPSASAVTTVRACRPAASWESRIRAIAATIESTVQRSRAGCGGRSLRRARSAGLQPARRFSIHVSASMPSCCKWMPVGAS